MPVVERRWHAMCIVIIVQSQGAQGRPNVVLRQHLGLRLLQIGNISVGFRLMLTRRHQHFQNLAIRSLGAGVIVAMFLVFEASNVRAANWMFRPSFYSHAPVPGLLEQYPRPKSRSAYRRAYVGRGFGFSVRSGYRINRSFLRSGNSTDTTIYHEGWQELGP